MVGCTWSRKRLAEVRVAVFVPFAVQTLVVEIGRELITVPRYVARRDRVGVRAEQRVAGSPSVVGVTQKRANAGRDVEPGIVLIDPRKSSDDGRDAAVGVAIGDRLEGHGERVRRHDHLRHAHALDRRSVEGHERPIPNHRARPLGHGSASGERIGLGRERSVARCAVGEPDIVGRQGRRSFHGRTSGGGTDDSQQDESDREERDSDSQEFRYAGAGVRIAFRLRPVYHHTDASRNPAARI
jgi:hypothetical protein